MKKPSAAPRVLVALTHAAFDPARRTSLAAVMARFREEGFDANKAETDLFFQPDADRRGSPWCAREAIDAALDRATESPAFTHVYRGHDDILPAQGFGRLLRLLTVERPDDVIDLYCNTDHPKIAELATSGAPALYLSADGGSTGACLWPVGALREFRAWWRAELEDDVPDDRALNLWAIATGRRIYKTCASFVDHDTSLDSLAGNTGDAHRRPLHLLDPVPESYLAEGAWRTPETVAIGRTYSNVQRELLWRRRGFRDARAYAAVLLAHDEIERAGGEESGIWKGAGLFDLAKEVVASPRYLTPDLVERVYLAERHGSPVDERLVAFASPSFRGLRPEVAVAMRAVETDLRAHGYGVAYILTSGHSLVTRARHRLCHLFMGSPASYLLQWDDDVVPHDPAIVRRMVETGYPIVGGGYPIRGRDGSAVACNPLTTPQGGPFVDVAADGTAAVRDLATGFMLLRRGCLADLMARHPELLYVDTAHGEFRYAPMWDLFGTFVDPGKPDSPADDAFPTYRSEDYGFCTRARAAGYEVRVMVDGRFDHHGDAVYRGSPGEAWGTSGGARAGRASRVAGPAAPMGEEEAKRP